MAAAFPSAGLLSIEGALGGTNSKTLFEVLLPVAPPRPQG